MDDDFGHKHIIHTRDANEAAELAEQMVKLSKLEAEIVTTRSKQPQVEINPDNPWTRSTPKVLVHLWLINGI